MSEKHTVYYPQDEMHTVMVPVTLGCSYNKCVFCAMYKGEHYSEVPLSTIENHLRNVDLYTEKIFLTGADVLAIGFDKMKRILEKIKHYAPYCGSVSSYASIRNLSQYSVTELSILHNLGLRQLYIGFETGRDDLLQWMKKPQTVEGAIAQAKKLNQASLPFNAIIMYGIGGKGEGIDNALATAKMLNQFKTRKIITMNLQVIMGTELSERVAKGEFTPASREERLIELKTLVENLQPKERTLLDTSHPTNIVKMIGTLPDDQEKLLKIFG